MRITLYGFKYPYCHSRTASFCKKAHTREGKRESIYFIFVKSAKQSNSLDSRLRGNDRMGDLCHCEPLAAQQSRKNINI
jgi:hypothetical protein